MNLQDGPLAIWRETRAQRWTFGIGLIVGLIVGALVTILFKPLLLLLAVIAIAAVVWKLARGSQGGPPAESRSRGMVITGRYAEPDATSRRSTHTSPARDDDLAAEEMAVPEVRRGPEYDAQIDAILANIDRQISGEQEGQRVRRSPGPTRPATDRSRVEDADWEERQS